MHYITITNNLGGAEGFSFFLCSPKFPMGSHQVLNMFPKGVPNTTSLKSHMFCPKSSPSYLNSWPKGEALHLPRVIFWGASLVSTLFCDGPIKLAHCQKKKKLDLDPSSYSFIGGVAKKKKLNVDN